MLRTKKKKREKGAEPMGFVLKLQRGRWEEAMRLVPDMELNAYNYLTCMTEFMIRGCVQTGVLPDAALAVLTWLLETGFTRGYLSSGLADEIVRLAHAQSSHDTQRIFREECVRFTTMAMLPLEMAMRGSAILFLRELGRGTTLDKRGFTFWKRCTDADPFGSES